MKQSIYVKFVNKMRSSVRKTTYLLKLSVLNWNKRIMRYEETVFFKKRVGSRISIKEYDRLFSQNERTNPKSGEPQNMSTYTYACTLNIPSVNKSKVLTY